MDILETLKELIDNQTSKRKEPCYIYRDEETNQIKEIPLKLDSAGSAYINRKPRKKINEARLIHDSIFGKP